MIMITVNDHKPGADLDHRNELVLLLSLPSYQLAEVMLL